MKVHPSGYYKWKNKPISDREKADNELLKYIKEAYKESRYIYGCRNIHKDLVESGIAVNKKRVARLMSLYKLYDAGMLKKKPI
ncbi:MAG: IS3 family transposase [Epsilonproteobacteria bacterium]|nr:IS3 family transposase [Campylobacterota bacterium]